MNISRYIYVRMYIYMYVYLCVANMSHNNGIKCEEELGVFSLEHHDDEDDGRAEFPLEYHHQQHHHPYRL